MHATQNGFLVPFQYATAIIDAINVLFQIPIGHTKSADVVDSLFLKIIRWRYIQLKSLMLLKTIVRDRHTMVSKLKLAILVNWKDEGNWSLLRSLKNIVQNIDVLQPISFKHRVAGRLTHISNYLSEFYLPLLASIRRKRFDVVFSYQMRIGVCYGILKRIVHSRKPPIHIIQDFHIDLTKTRGLYQFQIALLKLAIPGIDYFCCTSTEEEAIYSQMFHISRDRIVFLPLTESPTNFKEPSHPIQDYIFSYGKSDRDFDTLIRAVASLNIKTYILSKGYKPQVPVPENVSIIRDRISEKELIEWISSSRMVVLSMKDYRISAGQISMLEVMALARPLIITENMATKEYAVQSQTVLFFEAGNDKELAGHIHYLWNHRDSAEEMGREARQNASKFDDHRATVFIDLLERCAMDIQKGERQ
jgi:glycosyltransferase involved in cell wall biosynthesis